MKIDQSKLARQKGLINTWKNNGAIGTILAVTGFGKTFMAIMAAKQCLESPNRSGKRKILVVVPTLYLQSQWRERLAGFGLPADEWEVWVVNSAIKESHDATMLILDEIHRYAAPQFKQVFQQVDYDFLMGLTATLDEDDEKFDVVRAQCPILDRVTIEEALANDWVSDFIIYNLGLRLTPADKRYYKHLSREFGKYFSVFDWDFERAMKCLQFDYARRYAKTINYEAKRVQIAAVNFERNLRKRKQFLYNHDQKLETSEELIHRFPDKKIITFSQSTEFADRLTKRLGAEAVSYHSNMDTEIRTVKKSKDYKTLKGVENFVDRTEDAWYKQVNGKYRAYYYKDKKFGETKLKREALRKFNSTDGRIKCRVLNTAKSLDEGFDVEDIDMELVPSGTSVSRQHLQRLGRSIRKSEGGRAIIVEIFIRNTQDEKWLQRRQQESTNIQYVDRISDIV